MSASASEDANVNNGNIFGNTYDSNSEQEFAEKFLREFGDDNSIEFDDEPQKFQFGTGTTIKQQDNKPPPSYTKPTMASVLPPYLCGEVERVRNSYRTGSYCSIKRLPVNLASGQIRQTRKQHITENLLINSNNVFKPASILRNELFQRPEYIGTDYDKMKNLHKYLQDEEKVQTDSLSRKPFVIQSRIRSKTEDIFHDPEYRFPDMGPGTGLRKLENMVRVVSCGVILHIS
jgi:hypothetical protein